MSLLEAVVCPFTTPLITDHCELNESRGRGALGTIWKHELLGQGCLKCIAVLVARVERSQWNGDLSSAIISISEWNLESLWPIRIVVDVVR